MDTQGLFTDREVSSISLSYHLLIYFPHFLPSIPFPPLKNSFLGHKSNRTRHSSSWVYISISIDREKGERGIGRGVVTYFHPQVSLSKPQLQPRRCRFGMTAISSIVPFLASLIPDWECRTLDPDMVERRIAVEYPWLARPREGRAPSAEPCE